MINELTKNAIDLLKKLIETPSFSSEENETALLLEKWFTQYKIPFKRNFNNIWAVNQYFDERKPTLLLNSHHDTVKPNSGYTNNPFEAFIENGKLYGLGSNDAGGALVSLLATFTYFYHQKELSYNLLFVGSGEEESSGENGLIGMLPIIPKIDVAIVGEPTKMQLAVAEKGLLVFDAEVNGTPSHAAHINNDNAIYKTIETLKWFKNIQFDKVSDVLGEVKVTVSQINAGKEHNTIPASVKLVIDVRVNDKYTNTEINDYFIKNAPCTNIKARGLKLNSSSIPTSHPLVQEGIALGRKTYGSPTLSDQSVLHCPSLKMGPGDSLRSHTANEFIYIDEIKEGIQIYITLLKNVILKK